MAEKIKILIIDDEPDICYFLSRNLTNRGFQTAYSNTLLDATKQLGVFHPDILLLDNHLPDGKGIDFISDVKYLYAGMKIIMITAHDSPEDRSKAYSQGIHYFLSKPFNIVTMNQVLDLVL